MLSLILDSANKELGVALAKDNEIIDEIKYDAWQKQSELMIPEIEKIFKRNSISPKDVNEILVSQGPGSYTGVRIALTIAKVYAYALNLPIYAFSSLNILENPEKTSICLINAKGNRSYFAVYDKEKAIVDDKVLTNNEVIEYVNSHPEYVICGDASYIDIVSEKHDVLKNMLRLKSDKYLVSNVLSLKAVYLKDENEYQKSKN